MSDDRHLGDDWPLGGDDLGDDRHLGDGDLGDGDLGDGDLGDGDLEGDDLGDDWHVGDGDLGDDVHETQGAVGGPARPDPRGKRAPGHSRNRRRGPVDTGEPLVRRFPVLALVVALLVSGGLASSLVGRAPAPHVSTPASTSLAAMAAPVSSTASSWYCNGASGPSNPIAQGTLYLVSSSTQPVKGIVTVYNAAGHSAKTTVTVPALGETTVTPGSFANGTWLASRVDLNGGGVAVHQMVSGPTGWAMAPCSTEANATWYFASGATSSGNFLYVSLYNPTHDNAVVDLTFLTSQGVEQPAPFQGLILQPNQLVTVQVASYVQAQASVATIVHARSGRVVASELQQHSDNGEHGLSLRLGAPMPASHWYLPSSENVQGGTTQLVVLNPTRHPERVTVDVRLPSGPVSPLVQTVQPGSTWTLSLTGQTRIPANTTYGIAVSSAGGPGVVVDRVASAPAAAPAPQWGAVSAVCGNASVSPSHRWTLANPALGGSKAASGAKPLAVVLLNPGSKAVRATVATLGPSGQPLVGASSLRLGAHDVVALPANAVAAAGKAPLRVSADQPVVVTEDLGPEGLIGAVATVAVPQA